MRLAQRANRGFVGQDLTLLAELLGARQSRQEIEALMKTTGLDQQLKTLGYWPEWQSGARGRHP